MTHAGNRGIYWPHRKSPRLQSSDRFPTDHGRTATSETGETRAPIDRMRFSCCYRFLEPYENSTPRPRSFPQVLHPEAIRHRVQLPSCFFSFFDLRKEFSRFYNAESPNSIADILNCESSFQETPIILDGVTMFATYFSFTSARSLKRRRQD